MPITNLPFLDVSQHTAPNCCHRVLSPAERDIECIRLSKWNPMRGDGRRAGVGRNVKIINII